MGAFYRELGITPARESPADSPSVPASRDVRPLVDSHASNFPTLSSWVVAGLSTVTFSRVLGPTHHGEAGLLEFRQRKRGGFVQRGGGHRDSVRHPGAVVERYPAGAGHDFSLGEHNAKVKLQQATKQSATSWEQSTTLGADEASRRYCVLNARMDVYRPNLGEEPKVADAHEAPRQHVQKEPSQKLIERQRISRFLL
jgi:hypothetical protein